MRDLAGVYKFCEIDTAIVFFKEDKLLKSTVGAGNLFPTSHGENDAVLKSLYIREVTLKY